MKTPAITEILLIFLFFIVGIVTVDASTVCPSSDWHVFENRCYLFVDVPRDNGAAKYDCKSKGGTLATIDLYPLYTNQSHFGRSEIQNISNWIDGASPVYGNWSQGEPNNASGVEDCEAIYFCGFWNDVACSKKLRYICSSKSNKIPLCQEETFEKNNFNFTFENTRALIQAYSIEKCPSGIPRASIKCINIDDRRSEFSYNTLTIIDDCNDTSVENILQNVNFSSLNESALEDEILPKLELVTSVSENISVQDAQQITEFISNLSVNIEQVEITEQSFEKIVNLASNIAEAFPNNASLLNSNRQTISANDQDHFLESLITIGNEVNISKNGSDVFSFITPTITVELRDQTNVEPVEYKPKLYQNANESILSDPVSIEVPAEAINKSIIENNQELNATTNFKPIRIVFLVYKSNSLFPTDQNAEWVVSATVGNKEITGLRENVTIVYDFIQDAGRTTKTENRLKKEYINKTCVFWNSTLNVWSTDGCFLDQESNSPTCKCNHLTSFTIFFNALEIPSIVELDTISLVGSLISIVSLFVTILFQIKLILVHNKRPQKILLHLCCNLLIIYIIFLVGIDKRDQVIGCIVSTACLQYFLLTTWFWKGVYSHSIYKAVFKMAIQNNDNYLTKACLISYGVPIIIVGTNLAVTLLQGEAAEKALLSSNICWLHGYSFYFSFLFPVGLVLVYNVVVLFLVMRKLFWKREEIQSSREKATRREQLFVAITIAFTTGLTWVFGYLMLLSENEIYFTIFNIIFTLFISFQGLGLFLLLCVRNADARNLWWPYVSRCFACAQTKEQETSFTAMEKI